MKRYRYRTAFSIKASIPICIFFVFLCSIAIASAISVKSLIGTVTISRGNAILTPNVGDSLKTGDIIHLADRSYIVIDAGGSHYKIIGPKEFTVHEERIKDDAERSQSIDVLSQKLLKNMPPCNSKTITSGVRGIIDENVAKTRTLRDLKERLESELNLASEHFRKKNYDEALERFTKLSNEKRLNPIVRMNCRLFAAEIMYRKNEFGNAFTMYRDIYRTSNKTEFTNREFCLVRAILCAQMTRNHGQEKALLEEYRTTYGKSGKYSREVNELTKKS